MLFLWFRKLISVTKDFGTNLKFPDYEGVLSISLHENG